ncbi:MAG TPA: NAD-dependent epimerase/dehydratase family protein, partial [Candidatus Angelobacter sp.]|nr:NAD-dependent epimerase/dehydratase family protein [Candidatus Angelobacter sp.]
MKVLLFGATGMIGQGVLRESLLDNGVESVISISRSTIGRPHEKLREILRNDLLGFADIESELTGLDACFFCLGIASSGMSEEEYSRITYEITLNAARLLSRLNPRMTFIYVSGAGTDSSEHGRIMWARVKGKTENALLQLPFAAAYMFRPGLIEPLHGVKSKTRSYRIFYAL